jgi:hypothetical protein
MSDFKEFMPHVASIHDTNGEPVFSVIFLMPKKEIMVLLKKGDDSSGDHYHYSFLIEGTETNEWKKPKKEFRKSYGGFLGIKSKEIIYFEIPQDNENDTNKAPGFLHIESIQHSNPSIEKIIITHKGTIHFPGDQTE